MSEFTVMSFPEFTELDKETNEKLNKLFYKCFVSLGGTGIDVHLTDDDFHVAFDDALLKYQEMSSRSIYRTYGFLQLTPFQSNYILDERIDNVIRLYRTRGLFGGLGSGAGAFESFGAATANTLLRGGIGSRDGSKLDLVTFDFALQYQETLERLFAREIDYVYHDHDHRLQLLRVPRINEMIALQVSVLKSIKENLNDHWASKWLQSYTLAGLKIILGEKYSLFSTMPGAQGGTVMKGEQLKTSGFEEKNNLEIDILDYGDNAQIPLPVRG